MLCPHCFIFSVRGGGHIQDALLGEFLLCKLSGQTLFTEYHNAVRHSQQLLHIGGDHDHALAFLAKAVHELIDLILCAHIDAAGGLVKDDNIGLGCQRLAHDHLLLVAAGQGAHLGCIQIGALMRMALP